MDSQLITLIPNQMDPAITAAIIGSITAASTTAASELSKQENYISAVITNKTSLRWNVSYLDPVHGSWESTPNRDLISIPELESWIETKANAEHESDIVNFAKQQLLARHLDDHVISVKGKGIGAGFQGLVRLTTPAHSNMNILLLIDKRPNRNFKAGVSMSNEGWSKGMSARDLVKHIEKIHTNLCQYSEGGPTKITKLGPISVTFNGASVIDFEIKDDAYNSFN